MTEQEPTSTGAAQPQEPASSTGAADTAADTAVATTAQAPAAQAPADTSADTSTDAAAEATTTQATPDTAADNAAPAAPATAVTPAATAGTPAPAAPAPHAPPPHPPVPSPPKHPVGGDNPARWGRVDPDGTVYLKTATGERAVGSWQAGSPQQGLAHYARRFDDLRTEVELIEARLKSGSGDPKQALTTAKHLADSLADAAVVGDVDSLGKRLDALLQQADSAVAQAKQARDDARAKAGARKQELADEAERIATESTQWKTAGDRLRTILDEWKTIKGVDRKTDDALWRRFSKARDTFNRRRGSHFADLDRQRATAKTRKEELVAEAETLVDSDDWATTSNRYKQLMGEWKAAGRAPKDADDALWQRFRTAQDTFFAHRSAVFDERDAEFEANAKQKEELLVEAGKIDPSGDLDAARAQLHRIQERWEQVGKVPRERIRDLEAKLRAVEERVRTAADAQWRRTDPEAQARAAQFRERVEQFEAQAEKARAAGDTKRADQAQAQADQWREWMVAAEQAVASR